MKITRSTTIGITLLCALLGAPSLFAQKPAFREESLEAYNARMQWFAEAQYGMFIHFGVYSQLGGEWKGQVARKMKYAEWIQSEFAIPREEYAKLAEDFNPAQFDADFIVRTAKEAGMNYLVITSKHHDGFCLWDSKYTAFDAGSTPFKGRDILGELSEACRKYGIKFGLYYSIIDWNHPTQTPSMRRDHPFHQWGQTVLREGGKEEYVAYQTNQVLELIEKYDPALLWFDADWVGWWKVADGIHLYNTIREASPDVILNNRVGKRGWFEADYVTTEQHHFKDGFPKHWEACYTMNKSWGYKKGDNNWKKPETVYAKLKDINEKGGNLLLNVGPDGNGVIPAESVMILLETARLLKEKPIEKRIPTIAEVPRLKKSEK